MGIIKAVGSSVGGALADSWLEYIKPKPMGDLTVFTTGEAVSKNRKRGQNRKASEHLISDGSVIEVEENQCMLLVNGGRVVDYSAEAGYYTVQNNGAPSIFNGQLNQSVKETFHRVKFGGIPSGTQKVYYVNTQEIKNIPFGTVNPINYFDDFYNAELYLRCHGFFSIRVVDPLKFYCEVMPKNREQVEITEIYGLYLSEFMTALQTAIGQMSVNGTRISHVTAKSGELSKLLSDVLDEDWREKRGMEVVSVGISSVSYDDESRKLINMRNQGAMLGDPAVREGYVQGSVARGMEAAGANAGGAMNGFMGVGMGMQGGGGFMQAASASNRQQMQQQAGNVEGSSRGGSPRGASPRGAHEDGASPSDRRWTCSCGEVNTGKFCSECGAKRPEMAFCPECGAKRENHSKFCGNCGHRF